MQPKQSIPSSCQAAHAANLRALYQSWHSVPYPGALDETMRDCPVIDKENLPDALWGAVNQVDPEVRLRREEFSEDPIVKATQCLNVVYASLFELSYPPNVPHQWSLKLPGGHFLGKAPVYSATVKMKDQPHSWGTPYEIKHGVTRSAPESEKISNNHFPPVGYTQGDEGDSIRALVGIAHYVTRLLETYPLEKLHPVARELGAWPVMLQRGDKSVDAARAHLTDIQLGAASTIDVLRHGPDTLSNQVLVRELIEIHEYLADPAGWEYARNQERARKRGIPAPDESGTFTKNEWDRLQKESVEVFSPPTVDGWKALAISLPALSKETAKQWWPVVWRKLVEERHGSVHLRAEDSRLADLSGLCVRRAREVYLRNRLERLRDQARAKTGSDRISSAEIAHFEECVKELQAVNCTWCGPAAEKLGIAGMTIDKEIAAPAIRRALERAFKRMLS